MTDAIFRRNGLVIIGEEAWERFQASEQRVRAAEQALWHMIHRQHDRPITAHESNGCRACSQVHSLLAMAWPKTTPPPAEEGEGNAD